MLSDELFNQINNRPSLADYQVVKGLLEQAIDDLVRLQLRPRISDTDVEQILDAVAIILLGRDVSYAVVLGWNCDGGIDAALAREFELQDSDPLHIVGTYLGNTVNAALMLLGKGENRSLSLDAWLPVLQATILEASLVLTGYTPEDRAGIFEKNGLTRDQIGAS